MKKFFSVLIKSVLFFFVWAVIAGVIDLPFDDPALWRFGAELIPLLTIIAISIIFWLVEKRNIDIFPCKSILRSTLVGIASGIVWLASSIGILYVTGTIIFTGCNQISSLLLWIVSAFLNVVMQELLIRGYLYQLIKKNYGIMASTIVTTALFLILHPGVFEVGIIAVLNVVTMSLLMTALLEYTGSLTTPIFAHAIWNIFGSIIFGGVALSSDYPQLLNSAFFGTTLLSGGQAKFEGSIVILVVNILFCTVVGVLTVKQRRKLC